MTTIMPQGELMRKAVSWVAERQKETGESLAQMIERAAMHFNLSPNDVEFLQKFFTEQQDG